MSVAMISLIALLVAILVSVVFSSLNIGALAVGLALVVGYLGDVKPDAIIKGFPTSLFVLLAGGHPYSALTCFCVAWMTSLNPMLHAGWIGAYVEARVRKPPITDFRKIYETESIREMARIPLFKVVLVAALGNLGSLLGTVLYFIFVFPVLGIDPGVVISTGIHNMGTWAAGFF